MKGPAGVGKSAIAQSCVETLHEQSVPFAAFFFSVNKRDQAERFFPSIAYQLCLCFTDFRDHLNAKMINDKTIVHKSLRGQFQELIVKPLKELMRRGKGVGSRFPIFVDGLDECRDKQAQCDIIQIITEAIQPDAPPLCWAFFSRPEPHIEATFAQPYVTALTNTIFLPISRQEDAEIKLYLRSGFQTILRERNFPLGYRWPSDRDLKRLVDVSDGLFNFAATALRIIRSSVWVDPEESLRQVLDGASTPYEGCSSPNPFSPLDGLYSRVMQGLPAEMLHAIAHFLTYLCNQGGSTALLWRGVGVASICNVLGYSEMQMRGLCGQLSAVIFLHEQWRELVLAEDVDETCSFLEYQWNRRG
ncbi:hypothetical protein NP233_g12709 [Leucocoprinus birnbaumii]|uniref:Nephrocystin 3-like N-terminal domain-containing protein n=1 Tax=Leucocoprinus birnbaumii TaxID=56174 RepID=A0AAD5VFY3_9AGAR|nr:hypothetical protein NP233_g12709 [Leucocoprinus birnbaumii]